MAVLRAPAVTREKLAAARAWEPDAVLDVGERRGQRTERPPVEGPERAREQHETRGPARDLEAARSDVLVREDVTEEVEGGPDGDRAETRVCERAGDGARRDVKHDDHRRNSLVDPSMRWTS